MKRYMIFAMVTVFAAVMLCSCAGTESGTEIQAGTSTVPSTATASATVTEEATTSSETTTTSATEATTAVTEPTNAPEALISEYLDYFEKNKDKILSDDTVKYRLSVFQRNSSDVPGLMVEISSGTESTVERKYYGKFDKWIGEIPWHKESTAPKGETREYSSVLCVDSKGNYCEIVTQKEMSDDGTGRIYDSLYPKRGDIIPYSRVVYYSDSLEKLSERLSSWFVIPNTKELKEINSSEKGIEKLKNPETGYYEVYIYFLDLLNALGDVDIIASGYHAPLCRVSKGTYYSRWDEFTSDLVDVTECVKYSSEWISADDEVDKAEIIKSACEVLSTESATATVSETTTATTTGTEKVPDAEISEDNKSVYIFTGLRGDNREFFLNPIVEIDPDEYPEDIEEMTIYCSDTYPNIKYIDLAGIVEYPHIKKLTIMRSDDIMPVQIVNYESLSQLEHLEELSLNKVYTKEFGSSDLTFLRDLPSLKKLTLEYYQLKDGLYMSDIPQVNEVVLWRCGMDDLDFINDMPNLTSLRLENCTIDNQHELKENHTLKRLELSENISFNDIAWVKRLKALEYLYIGEIYVDNYFKQRDEIRQALPGCEINEDSNIDEYYKQYYKQKQN